MPARLECRVASVGSSNRITWDRAGVELDDQALGRRLVYNETEAEQMSSLLIEEASEEDFGTYGCKASNEVGVTYLSISLEQKGLKLDTILT